MLFRVLFHRLEPEYPAARVRVRVRGRIEELVDLFSVFEQMVRWHPKQIKHTHTHTPHPFSSLAFRKETERTKQNNYEPKHVDNPRQLVVLARPRKQRQTHEQFDRYTTQRPHVDRGRVRQAEQDFGRSVETGLDVGVDGVVFMTGGTEINHLDLGRR